MTINPDAKMDESQNGTEIYSTDPLVVKSTYSIDYIHSYAQDSEFFRALGKKKLMGSRCKKCHYGFATPRAHCMMCGAETEWVELPTKGKIHSYTTCYFGSEVFLPQTPFNLVLVEFDGFDSLFMARLIGAEQDDMYVGMPIVAKFKRLQSFSPTDVYFVPAKGSEKRLPVSPKKKKR